MRRDRRSLTRVSNQDSCPLATRAEAPRKGDRPATLTSKHSTNQEQPPWPLLTPRPPQPQNHDEYQQDLNPNPTAGYNIGAKGEQPGRFARTAAEVDDLQSLLNDYSENDLQRVPVLKSGTRLEQGAT